MRESWNRGSGPFSAGGILVPGSVRECCGFPAARALNTESHGSACCAATCSGMWPNSRNPAQQDAKQRRHLPRSQKPNPGLRRQREMQRRQLSWPQKLNPEPRGLMQRILSSGSPPLLALLWRMCGPPIVGLDWWPGGVLRHSVASALPLEPSQSAQERAVSTSFVLALKPVHALGCV